MMTRYVFLCLLWACLVSSAIGQQRAGRGKHRYLEVPADQGMLLIAPQPDCPLVFEDAKLVVDIDRKGPWIKSFELRNRGTKPIRAYTVTAVGAGKWGWEAPDARQYIFPGELAPPLGDDGQEEEIVPLTKELRQAFHLTGPMKGIVCMAVESVEYTDGTTYHYKSYEPLEEYFERLYATMEP